MYFFIGMGYGMISVLGIVFLYYIVIIVWCIFYFFIFFISELLWEKCYSEWVSERKYKIIRILYFLERCYVKYFFDKIKGR